MNLQHARLVIFLENLVELRGDLGRVLGQTALAGKAEDHADRHRDPEGTAVKLKFHGNHPFDIGRGTHDQEKLSARWLRAQGHSENLGKGV